MIKWIKNILKSRNKQLTKPAVIHSITCGERDENGFADTYVNGEKTNVVYHLLGFVINLFYLYNGCKYEK